ncbi:MAG: hypothetical protein OHK0039_49180 [Bacteroidia bacterium]
MNSAERFPYIPDIAYIDPAKPINPYHPTDMRLHTRLFLLTLLPGLLSLAGCKSGGTDCGCEELVCETCSDKIQQLEDRYDQQYLASADGYHKLIADFHNATNPSGSAGQVLNRTDLYFDMSDGMYDKIQEAETQGSGLLTDLVNVLSSVGGDLAYYRLQAEGEPVVPINSSNVKQFVRTAANYNASFNYAPLDAGVEAIVRNHDRQSVFITDGELARKQGSIDPTIAWAVESFTQWLREGNRLDFVVMPTSKNERLFFIFFTPRKLANRDNSAIEAFLEATRDVNRSGYSHLKFTISDYRLEKKDDGRPAKETGLNSTFVYNVGYYDPQLALDDGYEHIHLDDIESYVKFVEAFAAGDYNGDFEPQLDEKNKIFYNLLLTNEFINYQIANLDLRVEDFTAPLASYMNYQKCTQADTAVYIDEEGNKQVFWCNPAAGCRDTSACAFDEAQWHGRVVPEVFVLHEASTIQKGTSDFNTALVAVKPSPNLDVNTLYELGCIRLDLYIRDVIYDEKKQDFDLLKWPFKDRINSGLSESVRLAMRDLKPQNRLIYTWYLTFPVESLAL